MRRKIESLALWHVSKPGLLAPTLDLCSARLFLPMPTPDLWSPWIYVNEIFLRRIEASILWLHILKEETWCYHDSTFKFLLKLIALATWIIPIFHDDWWFQALMAFYKVSPNTSFSKYLCFCFFAHPISYSLLAFLTWNISYHLTTLCFVLMYLQKFNSSMIYLVWMERWEWYLIYLSYLLRSWPIAGQWFSKF